MSTFPYFYRQMNRLGLITLAILSLTAGPLCAESVVYEIVFKGTDGSMPKDWQKAGPPADADQFAIKNGVFRADSGSDFVVAWFSGIDAKGQPSDSWTDYTAKATVRLAGEAMTGVVGRLKSPTEFYHARIKGTGPKALFELYRIGGPNGSIALQDPVQIDYTPGESWRIELTMMGSTISAKLFNTKDEVVASLSGDDRLYRSGPAGVRVFSRGFAAVAEKLVVTTP